MSFRLFTFTLIASILLAACALASPSPGPEAVPEDLVNIRLPMGYIPSVQYAPFYVADAKNYFRDAGLEVEFDYSFETDGVALVGTDELQFSLASGEQVLLAREQGIPVVYVLAWWQDFPVAVAAKSELEIKEPADLEGVDIGLPGLFGASYIGLRALLNSAGLSEEDVQLDSIGFNQVEALVADQIQAAVVYANNEPIQLEAMGYDLDLIRVADYVPLTSNGLITNEKTIRENPQLVRSMVAAILKAVTASINDPDGAYSISLDYVEGLEDADRDVQMEILKTSIEFWRPEGAGELGKSNLDAWENMQQVLIDMGLLSGSLDLEAAYTNDFVD
jgi:NitT/TauT family transport system substrate-binding protein